MSLGTKLLKPMNLHLENLTAVVTGGSSGIGAAIVQALAAEGCHVTFCARNQDRIESVLRTVESLPGKVTARAFDVRDSTELRDWLDGIGHFDIFIPNVSALSDEWELAIGTDIRATVQATEAAIAHMAKETLLYAVVSVIPQHGGQLRS